MPTCFAMSCGVPESSVYVICSAEIGRFCPLLTDDCACWLSPACMNLLHQPLRPAWMAIDKVQRELHRLIALARAARLLTERAGNLIEKSHAWLTRNSGSASINMSR